MPSHSLKLSWIIPVTLLLGCPKDDGNASGGSDSSSSTGDTNATMTSGVTVTTATTMTTMDTMSASMTTMDTMTTMTTDMTTADSSTTDATETTDNPTGSESGSESGSGSTGGSESSTGGTQDGPYGECDFTDPVDPVCPVKGEECNELDPFSDEPNQSWCSIPCDSDDDCPDAPSGDALVQCSMFFGHCALNCSLKETCPDGMECQLIGMGVSRCVWPAM